MTPLTGIKEDRSSRANLCFMGGFPPKGWTIAAALGALALAAHAQDKALGRQLYDTSCASCHGPNAGGNGWLARYLTWTPPSLTDLAKRNGGTFPAEAARAVIDGREQVALHGPRDMPIWGSVFKVAYGQHIVRPPATVSPEPSNFPPPMASEDYVRQNIDSLLAYLADIQR